MKRGDLVRYKSSLFQTHEGRIYLVCRVEPKNNWVFIHGMGTPIQMTLMEVISESR